MTDVELVDQIHVEQQTPVVLPIEEVVPIQDEKDSKKKKKSKKNDLSEEERLAQEPNIRIPIRIFPMIGPAWILIFLSIFFSALNGAIPILFYILFGDVLDVVGQEGASLQTIKDGIMDLTYKLIGVAVGAGIIAFFASFFSNLAAAVVGGRLKRRTYGTLLNQEIGYFDIRKVGILVKRISEDTKKVEEALAVKLATLAQFIVQALAGFIISMTYSWMLSLFLICFGPLIIIVIMTVGSLEQVFTKLTSKVSDGATAKATEVIAAMRTVRSMSGEVKEYRYFKSRFQWASKLSIVKSILKFISFFCIFFLVWGSAAFTFYMGGRMIAYGINGHFITPGTLMQCFGCMLMAIIGAAMGVGVLPEIAKSGQSMREILKIYQRRPKLKVKGGIKLDEIHGEIEFRNVTFSYPSRPTLPVLKDFSLVIPVGKTTAFVGASGSGKSTITNLVEYFYDTDSGDVFLDGVLIRDLDPVWMRQHVGIVTQEPTLFSGTIEDNIKYGLPPGRTVTRQEVIDAATMANAHTFISNFKDGYKTLLGESSGLSGGQKQRIAIARMCLLNPRIILQDESTSALDSESEKIVQEALNRLTEGRTAIVIAHRLSTIKDADQIVVLERGKVVEIGTHNELLEKGPEGAYYKLAQKQMLFNEDEGEGGAPTSSQDALQAFEAPESSTSSSTDSSHE